MTRAKDTTLSAGDLARQVGTTIRTVRYYEELGLLAHSERSRGGHRRFQAGEASRLRFLIQLRSLGLSIAALQGILRIRTLEIAPRDAAKAIARVLDEQLGEATRRLGVLRGMREEFARTIVAVEACTLCERRADSELFCAECDSLVREGTPTLLRMLGPQQTRDAGLARGAASSSAVSSACGRSPAPRATSGER